MGLRITDRKVRLAIEIPEPERRALLAELTGDWYAVHAKGREPQTQAAGHARFLEHFQEVRATLNATPEGPGPLILDMAGRIRQSILGQHKDSELSHTQVDIATLLELL